jgi:hemin uptake protein HemP
MNPISPANTAACNTSSLMSGGIPAASRVASRPCVASSDLLGDSREMIIQHGDQEYRLRLTQNDKLILTK